MPGFLKTARIAVLVAGATDVSAGALADRIEAIIALDAKSLEQSPAPQRLGGLVKRQAPGIV